MRQSEYEIVFKKLAEATAKVDFSRATSEGDLTPEESQEIDDLRRIALEIEDPQPQIYTTT